MTTVASAELAIRFLPNAGGTADWTPSSTITGYRGTASLTTNATYRYRAESSDLSQWEHGTGIWNGTTLARTTIHSSSTGSKVNFSSAPQVAIIIFPDDLKRISAAIIRDEKSSGTNGGTFTSGADRTRDLNTLYDPDGIASLSSNQFTLQAGTYLIRWSAPVEGVQAHKSWLYNVTDATVQIYGASVFADAATFTCNSSDGYGIVTIASAKTFEIRHRCSLTQATFGFGNNAAGSGAGGNEIYTQVEILFLSR